MQGLITEAVAKCTSDICDLVGIAPTKVLAELIRERIQECVEAELDKALGEPEVSSHG